MKRKLIALVLSASLMWPLGSGSAYARGGGFGGGGGRGFGGARGFGGYGGGYHSYGGSMGRTPSFSSYGRSYGGYGGYGGAGRSYGGYGGYTGASGAHYGYGARGGSYTTQRGGTIDYGAAGQGVRGPGGGVAGRGVEGVHATTAGGRSFTDVNAGRGAVGPGGNAVGSRTSIAGGSGPRGSFVSGSHGAAAVGAGGAVAGRSFGATAVRPNGFNAYGNYHSNWVHGYWNGMNHPNWGWNHNHPYWGYGGWGGWGWGGGFGWGLGLGLGFGLASWGFGSALYGWGYMPYYNPYYSQPVVVVNQPAPAVVYDYSQPIDTVSGTAADTVTDDAMQSFDAGRAAFMNGDYSQALQQTDAALAKLPNDTAIHEFRALCLFALGRYDESASTLYAVLSVGPGWDWTTLIGLYPNVDVYTSQLRALESYCTSNPRSATGRFVLAYQYLTEGHIEAAVDMYKQVVTLKPNDSLSKKLAEQLSGPKDQGQGQGQGQADDNVPANPQPAQAPPETIPPTGATIEGTWKASPSNDIAVQLTMHEGGKFDWQVTKSGQTQKFSGTSTYGNGILTLAQEKSGPVLVGSVSWTDANHMTFRVVGDGPQAPGLAFSK
jgi:hypothetical protein